MKRKDIIEFEIGSMEFGGESSTLIGKRKVKMKGGINMAILLPGGAGYIGSHTAIELLEEGKYFRYLG